VRVGGREVRCRRMNLVKIEYLINAEKTPKTKMYKITKVGTKPVTHQHNTCTVTYNQTISDKDLRGNRGLKYTTCN
jgi:hypothetical protein